MSALIICPFVYVFQPLVYRDYINAMKKMNGHLFELISDADQDAIKFKRKLEDLKSDIKSLIQLIYYYIKNRIWNVEQMTFKRVNVEELLQITA